MVSYQEILANRQAAGELSENSSDYSFLFDGFILRSPWHDCVCAYACTINEALPPQMWGSTLTKYFIGV